MADLVVEFIEDAARDEKLGPSVLVVSTSSSIAWEVYMDGAEN